MLFVMHAWLANFSCPTFRRLERHSKFSTWYYFRNLKVKKRAVKLEKKPGFNGTIIDLQSSINAKYSYSIPANYDSTEYELANPYIKCFWTRVVNTPFCIKFFLAGDFI